ncbi:MAG: hypothetical protein ACT4N2_09130 [Hyphomicrobium sp.]
MKRALIAVLAALAVSAIGLGAGGGWTPASAQEAKPKKPKGLKGSIGYRRAYSYSKQSIVGWESRRFAEPGHTRQTPGGPFDNGFFFDSAIGKNGGDAPYMQ